MAEEPSSSQPDSTESSGRLLRLSDKRRTDQSKE